MIILVVTVVNIVRGKKLGGAGGERVKNLELVK